MVVRIDPGAGCCFGVERALKIADEELKHGNELYSLGQIVHNEEEMNALERKGLKVIESDELKALGKSRILFRAHGEPPASYRQAEANEMEIVDATCPIVKMIQSKVRDAYEEMKEKNGMVILYGKKGHPEVTGLVGYADDKLVVVQSEEELEGIRIKPPVRLFAQTTMDQKQYGRIRDFISEKVNASPGTPDFKVFNTICRQYSGREPGLKDFALHNDVMVFVSGKNSSNGKNLFEACRSVNSRSYWVSNESELDSGWFRGANSVGISGATSTPMWLLAKVAGRIEKI